MKKIIFIVILFFTEIKSIQEETDFQNNSEKIKSFLKTNKKDLADICGLFSFAVVGTLTFNKTVNFIDTYIDKHQALNRFSEMENNKNKMYEGPSFGTELTKVIGILIPTPIALVSAIWANKFASKVVEFAIDNIQD